MVTATRLHSEIGKIGHSVTWIMLEPLRLQVQTRSFVTGFAIVGIVAERRSRRCCYGLLRGAWRQGLLGGIALGMSMLPEDFRWSSPCSW